MKILLKAALDWAAILHRDQHRKYAERPDRAKVPYVSHVAGVALLLARHGFDDEVCAAGALHDVLEDCGVTRDDVEARFGARVASLVVQVSEEDKSLPWEARKAAYLDRFPREPWEAQAITLADKIDNLRSIAVCARDYGDPWPLFKRGKAAQIERFDALLAKARELPPHPLVDELADALDAVRLL